MELDFADALDRTQALRIAPPGQLFWYTSGTVGPYYINTHYLYGGPGPAEELLDFIDAASADRLAFPPQLASRVAEQYEGQPVYRGVVDALAARVRGEVGEAFDWVSGGERRDWFFSAAVARLLGKPHLLIYKDRGLVLEETGRVHVQVAAHGRRVVHVADLVTEASSYLRAWIPALADRRASMVLSANVVDRSQGGLAAIAGAGVVAVALVRVDEGLFAELRASGRIDGRQEELLLAYYRDPHGAMKSFLQNHPEFVPRALASEDERTAARARLLVERNPYGLDPGLLR